MMKTLSQRSFVGSEELPEFSAPPAERTQLTTRTR